MAVLRTADSICEALVTHAARELRKCEFGDRKQQYWLERDLQGLMRDRATALGTRRGISSVTTGFRAPIPNWWPAAGDVDLVLESKADVERRFDLYELKWCNHNKMEEALWDIVKMVNAHDLPEVRSTYLVYGAPARWWRDDVVGVKCFAPGTTQLQPILFEHETRWRAVVNSGSGRPTRGPRRVHISSIATESVAISGIAYQLRAVSVVPIGNQYFALNAVNES
jgi:hypothetical protein